MIFAITLALVFYVLGITWLIRVIISYRHIKKARSIVTSYPAHAHIDILLPVLEEDERLKSFIKYSESTIRPLYSQFTIWIITTEQEATTSNNPITWKIADELAAKHDYIQRVHYPKQGGVMAHQLNFALDNIKPTGLFVVYNADSQPDPETFGWVNYIFQQSGKAKQIFQQYGNYLRNYNAISTKKWGRLLLANGMHQNRCTLGYEYYNRRPPII